MEGACEVPEGGLEVAWRLLEGACRLLKIARGLLPADCRWLGCAHRLEDC